MKLFTQIKRSKTVLVLLLLPFIFSTNVLGQKKYPVQYNLSGKDTLYHQNPVKLKDNFSSPQEALTYITQLPDYLLAKGFPVASVDTFSIDSAGAKVELYLGPQYKWGKINTDSVELPVLNKIGLAPNPKDLPFDQLPKIREKVLNYYEGTGYPFAQVSMKNVQITNDFLSGDLWIDKGRLYTIDSIRIFGELKIKNRFIQKYLDLPEGSIYNRDKLEQVSKYLRDLPYLAEASPWNITMLGSGSILNLYLQPRKSSRVDVLVGFLPGNEITGKTQITADVNLDLKNALGSGENILVNWQQLQPQSPRLKLGYSQPYVFNSNFGIDLSFDLFKLDSAYLDLKATYGLRYIASPGSELKIFFQNNNSYLLSGGLDTNQVLISKRLPANIDVRSGNLGVGYQLNSTDYRFNPRKGTELDISGMAGIKKINKNNDILNLKDAAMPSFDFSTLYDSLQLKSYRFTITGKAAHYVNFSGNNVAKLAVNAGLLQSPQLFQNELFRLGGYHLLRGFREESIYASSYAILTAEYRYLLGLNSFFFAFSEGALTKTNTHSTDFSNRFVSGGIGLEFETKVGLLNISFAIGKRNDVKFDIRNSSKIHFGYINYF